MNKKYLFITLLLIIALSFTACSQLDVIGNTSVSSFEKVLNAMQDRISEDEERWSLTAPDDSAKFYWSKDFSTSKDYDVMIEIDAKPFIDAGLDINKFPAENISGDKIIIGTNLGDESLSYDESATPIASYKKIVELKRKSIQYHAALDHYGISLSNGNAFEWAKDIVKNDKDIVFALNPQIFIDAGVDPNKVEGWVFAKIETMDEKGKTIEIDKLLKPFNIE